MPLVYGYVEKYMQGSGLLNELPKYCSSLRNRGKVVFITSQTPHKKYGDQLKQVFENSDLSLEIVLFNNSMVQKNIDSLKTEINLKNPDLIVGFGGGQVLDTGRYISTYLKLPFIVVPSIAATDAPCLPVTVFYDDEGRFCGYDIVNHPKLVVVDTDVILEGSKRHLVAGMGDGLSTYYEALLSYESQSPNLNEGLSLKMGIEASKLCRDLILENGVEALEALKKKKDCPAFQKIVEANIFLSGLGVEAAGICMAHALDTAFTQSLFTKATMHGERVAFGLLCQLVHNDLDKEVQQLIPFYKAVGLPLTLSDLGLDPTNKQELGMISEYATQKDSSIFRQKKPIEAKRVYDILLETDKIGATQPS